MLLDVHFSSVGSCKPHERSGIRANDEEKAYQALESGNVFQLHANKEREMTRPSGMVPAGAN